MSVKEDVTRELETLSEAELQQVAEYLVLLKFRARMPPVHVPDAARIAALYAEFAEEDRVLAETGMAEYSAGL